MIFLYKNDLEYRGLLASAVALGVDYIDDSYEDGYGCIEVDIETMEEENFMMEGYDYERLQL